MPNICPHYDAPSCLLVNLPTPPTPQLTTSRTITLVNSLTCQLVNLKFCQLFGIDYNILSALSANQRLTLPQNIDSREGLVGCKKRSVVHTLKMNFYLNIPPLIPVFGRFAAKCGAFWC